MQKYLKICSYLINKKNLQLGNNLYYYSKQIQIWKNDNYLWNQFRHCNFKTSKFQAISKFQKFQNISKFLKFSTKFKILKGQFNSLSCNSLLKTIDASIDHRGAKNAKISENM
jgi:hypothetical protein